MQNPAVNPSEALSKLRPSGKPISGETFTKARRVLKILENAQKLTWSPFVFPTEVGGIHFEWRGGQRELDIEILPDSTKVAYVRFENGSFDREGDAEISEQELLALFRWMR